MDSPDRIDRSRCQRCEKCASACPGTGLRVVGAYYELDDLVELILRDKEYYQVSGGGVTLSGGEPAFFMQYTGQLLCKLREYRIHTTIETAGFFKYDAFYSEVLPFLSLILYDIKLIDDEEHQAYTGQSNRIIIENFHRLVVDSPIPIIPRVPLIPGITAISRNLQAVSDFLRECGLAFCWLLPYNPLGLSKRKNIGKQSVNISQEWMSDEEKARCESVFSWARLVDAANVRAFVESRVKNLTLFFY